MKTQEEINEMIAKLERCKKNIPKYSALDTPNHKVIESQIAILRGHLDKEEIPSEALAIAKLEKLEEGSPEADEMVALVDPELREAFDWLEGKISDDKFVDPIWTGK